MATILSPDQENILTLLGGQTPIANNFYLSGGTALAEFYLHHRLSEDLDFFSEQEFSAEDITVVWRKLQKSAGISEIRYEQSFNRHLYFLTLASGVIKTEFTHFPFPRIEMGQKLGGVVIDSLLDIAVNKVFTIYQKPRSRDFIDLYLILRSPSFTLPDLVSKAQIKFDHYLDPIQLGAQFMKVEEVKDYPRMIASLEHHVWQNFFLSEAKKLAPSFLQ